MDDGAVLGLNKIRSPGQLLAALRHNQRAAQREVGSRSHIDASRTIINSRLLGEASPEASMQRAREHLEAAGIRKLRANGVLTLEVLVSLHPGHGVDEDAFFDAALGWLVRRMGGIPIAADVHRDEAAPHLHLLVLPLVSGRMVGSDLVSLPAWSAIRKAFFADVAAPFGLKEPPGRLRGEEQAQAVQAVLGALQMRQDPALKSTCWEAVRQSIERDPRHFAALLGIEIAEKRRDRHKTMAEIFTGRGRRTTEDKNPRGNFKTLQEMAPTPAKRETLPCEGNFDPTPQRHRLSLAREVVQNALERQARRQPAPPPWTPEVLVCDNDITRVRDNFQSWTNQ